jgi:hypothetical protein
MNQDIENQSENHPELDGQLETAVWAVLSDPIPADAVERVKQRALQTTSNSKQLTDSPRSRKRLPAMIRFVLAASIMVAIVGGFALMGIQFGSSSVYAQAVKRLESLTSMVCHVQFSPTGRLIDLGNAPGGQQVTYLAPSLHRIEDKQLRTVQIIDREQNRIVILMQDAKQAIVAEGIAATAMDATSPARVVEALLHHFRADRIGDESIKSLGTQTRDGAKLEGYESTLNGEIVRAWFDTESHAPVIVAARFGIPAHMTGGEAVSMWRVMSNIELNVDVEDSQFSTTLPDGYQPMVVEERPLDLSPTTLEDVIEMLRLCANANGSKFPLWLSSNDDIGTPMTIQKKAIGELEKKVVEGTEAEKAAVMKTAQEFGSALGRAMAFQFSVKPDNDWNYFGGAALNQPNRPVLWYSPNADGNYKVVYADLTVRHLTRGELPSKPNPVARPATARNSIRVSTPRFGLPANAVGEFIKLKQVRDAGKQAEVEYLSLAWMPEFMESQVQVQDQVESIDAVVMQEVDPRWKPERSADSSRLAFLKEFTNLKGLDLSHLYLTQNDLDTIGSLTGLQRLSLSGVQVFDSSSRRLVGEDLVKLSNLSSLELLDLSQSNFAGGLKYLKELPRLHTLYLSSFEHLNDASVAELSVLPHLESLVLAPVYSANPKKTVTAAGLEGLKQLPSLRTLYVGYHGKWTLPVERLRELLPDVNVHSPTE